jgi:predicted 3-demethylubiquinone-9 3-methyltransferase (glyoxalase superfamily)
MQLTAQKITPCLWFDSQAEEAAKFYASVFKNSKVGKVSRYGKEGFEIHGKKAGTVMTAEFEIEGQKFVAFNGGPHFKFNEAVSFQVHCENQQEIDYFWSKLAEGGQESRCGWLKDKFGLSWQIVPARLTELLSDPNPARAAAATKAMLGMQKIVIADLEAAADAAAPAST